MNEALVLHVRSSRKEQRGENRVCSVSHYITWLSAINLTRYSSGFIMVEGLNTGCVSDRIERTGFSIFDLSFCRTCQNRER